MMLTKSFSCKVSRSFMTADLIINKRFPVTLPLLKISTHRTFYRDIEKKQGRTIAKGLNICFVLTYQGG